MGLGKTYSADYLIDSNGNSGVSGQVLISTATGIDWSDGSSIIGGPFLPLAGGTMTGNTIHNDNVKSIYGTGSDLQIYHDGSNSYINETGTGNLFIQADSQIRLGSITGSEKYARFNLNGNVELFYDNAIKFETTTTGVTITGKTTSTNDIILSQTGPRIDFDNGSAGSLRLFSVSQGAAAMTLTSAGNATFPGTVTINNNTPLIVNGTDPLISFQNAATNHWQVGLENSQSDRFVFYDNNAAAYQLILESTSGNATFAGEISSGDDINSGGKIVCANVGSDKKIAFRRTGGNNFSIEHDSDSIYFYNESTSSVIFKMANNNNATFAGSISAQLLLLPDGADVAWAGGYSSSKPVLAANGTTMKMYPSGATSGVQFSLSPTVATFTNKVTSSATVASDGSTTLATKSYVDGLVTGVPVYKGTWAAGTTGVTSAAISTTTITLATAPAETIAVGDVVTADGITAAITVTVVASQTSVTASAAVTIATGVTVTFSPVGGYPDLTAVANKVLGNYYIVSTAGSATPNGSGVEPDSWAVGDWCIFSDVTPGAGTDLWQRIDNSSVISGAGTGQRVALWAGATNADSETLANAPITVSGNDSAFTGNVSIAEKLIHSGDTNTYIQFASTNDKIVLATNGGDALTIDASQNSTFTGNIAAPQIALTTSSTTVPALRLIDAGVIAYDWTFPDTGTLKLGVSSTSTKTLSLLNAGTGKFNLSVDGNVDIITPITNAYFGLGLKYTTAEVAIFKVNNSDGQIRIGGNSAGYFPTFFSAGTEKMRITTGGDVGIGKTSSLGSHKLSILKVSNQQLGLYYDETHLVGIGAKSTGDAQIYGWNGSSYRNILLGMDGNTAGGSVGIGTANPSKGDYGTVIPKLHVVGPSAAGASSLVARFQAGDDANDSLASILINHSNDRGLLIEAGRGGAGTIPDDDAVSHLGLINSAGALTRMITLRQSNADAASSYNVGIGTTGPVARLDVKGVGTANGLTFRTTDASDNEIFYIKDGGTVGVRYYPFKIGVPSGTSNVANSRFQIATTAGDFVVLNDGKTGIGTQTPTERLEVDGNLITLGKTRGLGTNYATSEGWFETAANTFTNMTGYFGGNFARIGAAAENKIEYATGPFNTPDLVWMTVPEVASNDDGGWNKIINGFPNTANNGFMSVVYVRRDAGTPAGSFYHGCSNSTTNNLDGTSNGNPYFCSFSVATLPADVWCVSIGIIYAANDGTTASSPLTGTYRMDTGQKIHAGSTYRQKPSTSLQEQRVYHYYSTSPSAQLDFTRPGWYVIDGSEPTLNEITGGAATDAFWSATGADIHNDNSGSVGIGTAGPKGKLHVLNGTAASYTPNSEADTLVIEAAVNPGGISLIGTGSGGSAKTSLMFGTTSDVDMARLTYDGNNSVFTIGTTVASNNVAFTSGNSVEAMRITAAGDLVVNGTAVGALNTFSVKTDSALDQRWQTGVAHNQHLGIITGKSNGFQMIQDTSDNLTYRFHGGTNAILLDVSTDGVGIGTTSPNDLGFLETVLNINAGSSSSTTLQQAGLVISGSSDANDQDDFSYLSFTNNHSTLSSDRVAEIRAQKAGSNVNTGQLAFFTANGTALNESMVLGETGLLKLSQYGAGFLQTDASGNITAGTVTTSDTLDDVTDNGNTTTNSITVGNITSTGGGDIQGDDLYFRNGGDDGAGTRIGNVWYSVSTGGGAAPVGVYESAVITTVANGTHGRSDLVFKTKDNNTANFGSSSEHMRITKTGNVGIATASPNEKLQVGGNISIYDEEGNTDANLFISKGSTNVTTVTIASNGVSYFNGGNVGIGTTSPTVPLDVSGSDNGVSVRIKGDMSAGAYYYGFMFDGANLKGTTETNLFYAGATIAAETTIANYAGLRIDTPNVSATNAVVTNNYGIYQSSTLQKNFFNGKVGIGTTAPGEKLQVQGNIVVNKDSTAANFVSKTFTTGHAAANRGGSILFGMNDSTPTGMRVTTSAQGDNYNKQEIEFITHKGAVSVGTRMFIDAIGNVGIGTVAPQRKLHVSLPTTNGDVALFTNDVDADLNINFSGGTTSLLPSTDTLAFGVSSTEAMRITSNRNVLIGKTADDLTTQGVNIQAGGAVSIVRTNGAPLTLRRDSNNVIQIFRRDATLVGRIDVTTNSTSYGTSSDYRLKEDLQDFNGLDIISKIKMYNFKWKNEDERSYGVVAHELQAVLPQAVAGNKDDVEMQGVDYSKLVPLLVKSVQELTEEIKLLKQQINK